MSERIVRHMGRTRRDRDAHQDRTPDDHAPDGVHRRTVLRGAGGLGASALAAGAVGAGAEGASAGSPTAARGSGRHGGIRPRIDGYLWLAGDHHTHTQYSSDGLYRVADQVRHAAAYGLDWLVITDHGHEVHAGIGAAAQHADILTARREFPDLLVFQGLEWHIPAAEHGTVFVHPGRDEVAVLTQFETAYDAAIVTAQDATPQNEALAVAGLGFLAEAVRTGRVADALFLANHPSQNGIDSPHEIRGWRDAQPRIAVGMEAAPGHQAAGIAAPNGPGTARGLYDRWPQSASFPGYPAYQARVRKLIPFVY